ncbi:TauD/TfdA family dioxygenase [Streptomyces sp. NPDC006173]|uniref:TauD/TfdA family dioxygenase n=1 Tax=Streptomyces sp. NPDC006173 TaxID=3155349 RepID=UPI0033D651F3
MPLGGQPTTLRIPHSIGIPQGSSAVTLHDNTPKRSVVRLTAKMLERSQPGPAHSDAARELAEQLVRSQVTFMLQPGDYLIVNQRRFLHGREPLHRGQQTVPVSDRPLLLQLFLRA